MITPEMIKEAEASLIPRFAAFEAVSEKNTERVLQSFWSHKVSDAHLQYTNGYGYDDIGRDTLDAMYAEVFGGEDALVRHSLINGTHAISTALFGVLRPGDTLLSVTGKPYDTLLGVIGLSGEKGSGTLFDYGIQYEEVPLCDDMDAYLASIEQTVLQVQPRMVYVQRSRGYARRRTLTIAEIGRIAELVKSVLPDAVLFVDNCYGEFCEALEPCHVGASLIAGSLIKNPGGGLAPCGGYIVGEKALIALCAARHTVPGIGKEAGCSLDFNRLAYQGLFMAPHVVMNALKTALFAAKMAELYGFDCSPSSESLRSDIIQTITFHEEGKLLSFMAGIQSGAPINSYVTPVPWDMPGYDSPVVMAAGAFVAGASIELSADGKILPPYTAFLQGGLTYESGKIGILRAFFSL